MIATRKIITALSLTAILGIAAAAGAAAFAYGLFAPVSGQQAAASAAAQIGGFAKEVEYEYKPHIGGRYQVEVIGRDNREYEVLVSAENGQVQAVQLAENKERKHHDEEEREHEREAAQPAAASATATL